MLDKVLVAKKIKLASGIELEFAEKGNTQGKTIIFLHGYSDSWHSFENIISLMPDSLRCIAISQRGHGNSSKPQNGYHPKDFAKDLADFIQQNNLSNCIVVGHSMGGLVAQQFALDYPKLLRGLIIISSDACFNDNPGFPDFKEEIMKLNRIDYAFAESFQKSTIAKPIDSALLKLYITESMKLPTYVWHQTIEGIFSVNYTEELKSVNVPVLILWGSQDQICFRADQQKFLRNLKKSKLIPYEGIGHALHWEEPKRFASDLINFASKL